MLERTSKALHRQPDQGAEAPSLESLYVDAKKSESVEVDAEVADKIRNLLERQEGMGSHDIHEFFETGDSIQGANCHKTALYLTGKYSEEQLFAPDNTDPQYAGHEYVEKHTTLYDDPEDATDALQKADIPFRISFFKDKDGKPFAYHSITVLGMSSRGRLIGFEKLGPYSDNPFRYINAGNTLTAYLSKGYLLGIEKAD